MSEKSAEGMLNQTIEKIKTLVDASTIIGSPVVCGEVTVIPVSKVTYGFAAGGSDLPSKNPARELFGGGGGAGITIQPIGFLSITGSQVKLLPINPPTTSLDRVVELVPDAMDKVGSLITSIKEKKDQAKEKKTEAAEKTTGEVAQEAAEAIRDAEKK